VKRDGFRASLLVALALSLCACETIMSRATLTDARSDPSSALVTLLRPAGYFGEGSTVGMWDGRYFVGFLHSGELLQFRAAPGQHLLLADAEENWSYARADLRAGKEYFVRLNMFPGILANRVALATVPKTDERIPGWLARLQPVAANRNDTTRSYTVGRVPNVDAAIAKFKSGAVTSFADVKPDDGR